MTLLSQLTSPPLPVQYTYSMIITSTSTSRALILRRGSSFVSASRSSTLYSSAALFPPRPVHRHAALGLPPKSLVSTASSRAFSSSLAVLPGSSLFVCLEQYYLASRIRHNVKAQAGSEKDSHQKNAAVILASSSAIMATRDSLLHRYWRWLKSWFQAAWKAVLVASRSTEIALRLSPLTILAPLAVLTQSNYWNEVAWRYTISTVQGIGPVAVKFCQWIATRRDIFPPYLCDRLGVLHDRGYPHSWDHTHQVLTDAFGDYKERGLTVEEVVGCGSAAQVYKGSLKETDSKGVDSKRPVAIKVLHPKFSWNVERDLALMQSVADFVHSIPSDAIRMVNLPRATENFGKVLRLQADLTNEARNLQQFRSNFYKDDNDKEKNSAIAFPQPIPGWFSSRVLVEDYVLDAIPISNYLQDSTPDGLVLRRKLAGPLLRAFLKMVFVSRADAVFSFLIP